MLYIRFYNLSLLDWVIQIYSCSFLYLHGKDRTLFSNGWRKLECLIRHHSAQNVCLLKCQPTGVSPPAAQTCNEHAKDSLLFSCSNKLVPIREQCALEQARTGGSQLGLSLAKSR